MKKTEIENIILDTLTDETLKREFWDNKSSLAYQNAFRKTRQRMKIDSHLNNFCGILGGWDTGSIAYEVYDKIPTNDIVQKKEINDFEGIVTPRDLYKQLSGGLKIEDDTALCVALQKRKQASR